ncbi:hypothetical protein Dimus_005042 [Dionaea muscipula]
MAAIFRRVHALYVTTAKKEKEEIETSRRLEEKEKFIEGYDREFSTLKKSYKSSIKNALDRS